jgi:cytochrome c-type biogenesis protein CcmH/NrfG
MAVSMRRRSLRLCAAVLTIAGVAFGVVPLHAADTWVAVDSPHVTVISNAGDSKAARIASQFEQVRAALVGLLPSANVPLHRPFVVIAAKDESTLKSTAPAYFQRSGAHPYTVVVGAPDKHLVALRADVEAGGRETINPYLPAFRNYTSLMLDAAYGARLPFALRDGFSWVFGNAAIAESDLQLGRINPPLRTTFLREARLHLAELLALTPDSPYVSDPSTRGRFSAQSWALVQHLLVGVGPDGPKRLTQLVTLLTTGTAADAAFRQAYGSLDDAERAEFNGINNGRSQLLRVGVEAKASAAQYPLRALTDVDADAARAAFQLASGSPAESARLLAAARSRNDKAAAIYEIEGLAADRERNTDAAQRAYTRAADLGSTNFYVYVRLASASAATATAAAQTERLLGKAIELNQAYAPSLTMLATLMFAQNRAANALGLARRAVQLEPENFSYHLLLARILQRTDQSGLAQSVGRETLALARTEQERQVVRSFLAGTVTAPRAGVTLKVTDTSGVSTSISAPAIGYASGTSSAVIAERDGIKVYQGQGQVVVNWSRIESIAFSAIDSAASPPRIKGRLTLAGSRPLDRDFVVPSGRLTGQTDVGSFSIALSDIVAISVARTAQ